MTKCIKGPVDDQYSLLFANECDLKIIPGLKRAGIQRTSAPQQQYDSLRTLIFFAAHHFITVKCTLSPANCQLNCFT
jgi:hypothetical protein